MVANTGTYVDCPFHRFADGADLAQMPADAFLDLDAIVAPITTKYVMIAATQPSVDRRERRTANPATEPSSLVRGARLSDTDSSPRPTSRDRAMAIAVAANTTG